MFGKPSDNRKAVVEEEVSEEDEKPKPKKAGKKSAKDAPVADAKTSTPA